MLDAGRRERTRHWRIANEAEDDLSRFWKTRFVMMRICLANLNRCILRRAWIHATQLSQKLVLAYISWTSSPNSSSKYSSHTSLSGSTDRPLL